MKRIIYIAFLLLTACGELADYGRPAEDGERVFYGDSITEMCAPELNRGTAGYESADILPEVRYFASRDGKAEYSILIGINDISHGEDKVYMYSMNRILGAMKIQNVTIISILPTAYPLINAKVRAHNEELKLLANHFGMKYRDAYSEIRPEHISDGVHLTEAGCEVLYGDSTY